MESTDRATASAREAVFAALQERLRWWQSESCGGSTPPSPRAPDVDATLCRLGTQTKGFVLTNQLLVRNLHGRLHAVILIDQRDKHLNDTKVSWWPARSLAQLQQLAELQARVDEHSLPALPPFTVLVSSHDSPVCGLP